MLVTRLLAKRYAFLIVLTVVIGSSVFARVQNGAGRQIAVAPAETTDQPVSTTVNPVNEPVAPAAVDTKPLATKPQPAKPAAQTASAKQALSVSEEEFDLLARMISAEATQQPYEGMVAVGAVILNRVKSSKFPDTIKGVLYQAGQFQPVTNGWLWKTQVTETHRKAARDAVAGADPTSGALYFFVYEKVTSAWLWARPHKITIGDHRFTA